MKVVICPYCGQTQSASERCRGCGGLFEPLSRQATHNAMGPWFVRDPARPFHPGCSYETLLRMIDRGQVTKYSVLRGPTTRQFWTVAKHVPGVAHVLGYCHNCDASVDPGDHGCHACGVPFGAFLDRNFLGLPEIRPLPWEAQLDEDSPQALGSGRTYEWARPGEAGGISHFASDEELLGMGSGGGAVAGAAGGADTGDSPQPEAQAARTTAVADARHAIASPGEPQSPAGQTIFDDYALAAVSRAQRRKLAGQQRTIRILAILLLGAALIAVGSNLGSLAAMFRNSGPPAQPAPAEDTGSDPAAPDEVKPDESAPSGAADSF